MASNTRRRHRRERKSGVEAPRRRSRRWFLILGVSLLVLAAAGAAYWAFGRFSSRGAVNVLLITLDTTRADHLSCYGSGTSKTPELDRVARDGAMFGRCSTSAVMTLPSHCTIMTGLDPYVHGVRRNGVDHLPPAAHTLAEAFKAAGCATAAAVASVVLDPKFGLAQGFDVYHAVPRGPTDAGNLQRKGDQICDDVLGLLRERARQRFFIWAHFYDPHYPYESTRHPDVQSPEAYADEVEYMDSQIGRLLDGLRQLGLEQNTLVVLVGDHGEGLDDHLEYQHGYFLYETCERVPLLMRLPGTIPAGRRIDAVVRTADLAPTILDLAGLPPLDSVLGVSLRPLLTGQSADLQLKAYAETPQPYTILRLATIRALTAGRWKYVWTAQPQLFDLEADPGELHDVIGQHADTAAALKEQLAELLADAPPRLAGTRSGALSSDEVARLESLGYIGLTAGPEAADADGLGALEPVGADAYAQAPIIRSYEQARELIGKNRFAEAEAELQKVIAALPQAPSPLRDLAHVQRQLGKLADAAGSYERLLKLMPTDARTRVQYAAALVDSKRYADGAVQAEEAVRLAPGDPTAHTILGIAYFNQMRFDQAREQLENAVRLDPTSTQAQDALGRTYMQQERFADAAECFRTVLRLDPRNETARTRLQAAEQRLRK